MVGSRQDKVNDDMTSRIHRGFHRIGVAVAAIPAVIGIVMIVAEASWQARTVGLGATEPKGFQNLYNIPNAPHFADYTEGIAALVVAVAIYAAARAVGWVLDGFARPDRST